MEGPRYVATVEDPAATGGHDTAISSAKRVALLPEMVKLASNDILAFRKQCGDSFVAVNKEGARINEVLTFHDVSHDESKQLSVAAQGGGFGTAFSSALKTEMDKFDNQKRFSVSYLGLGGASQTIPLTKEDMLNAVAQLPAQSRAAARPFEMVIIKYSELPNWPPVVLPRNLTDMEVLASAYWRLRTLYLFANDTLTEPHWLLTLDTNRGAVVELQNQMLTDMNKLQNTINHCIAGDPCTASDWRSWKDLDYRAQLPMRGSWADISYNSKATDLNQIFNALADARIKYWIEPPVKLRCQRDGDCVPIKGIDDLKSKMISRMRAF